VLATLAAYAPAWRAGFIWDDDVYVTQNRLLTAPDGLRRIWFSRDAPSQYFPLTYTALRWEHSLWGLNPAGYHLVNLILHGLNAVLLWQLLRRLQVPGAWLGAALFALHPVNVESVAWVTELKNLLSLLFYLTALRFWVEFVDGGRRRFYFLALAAHALALLSKSTACTLPAGLALIIWWRGEKLSNRRWTQLAPFLAMSAAMGALAIWWERFHQNAVGQAFAIGWPERFLSACHALWFYAGKLILPVNLMFIYPKWNLDRHDLMAWLWPGLTALAAISLYLCRSWVGRGTVLVTLFYVAALSPLLGFIMEYTFRYTFVADHYQYIAIVAPCALAGAWLQRNRAAAALALAIFGVLTWRQARIYHDSETLWRANLVGNPTAPICHNNLAAALLTKGELGEAIAESRAALVLDADSANAHNNLGYAFLRQGRVEEAVRELEKAAALDPGNPSPPYNLGQAALAKKDFAKAVRFFDRTIALRPGSAEAHCNRGYALLQLSQTSAAISSYETALELDPNYALANNDLGSIYLSQRRFDEARLHFQRAVASQPDFAEAQCNLAEALLHDNRREEAIAHLQAALRVRPGFPPAARRLQALQAQ
jgi:tetratricopeptide (TPR) repeat protein